MTQPIKSVLFACNMNSVRSPMAAALLKGLAGDAMNVDSAGVYEGGLDPFVQMVMEEKDIAMEGHEPKLLSSVDAAKFDLLVVLTPEAAAEARKFAEPERIEFWDVENPSDERGDMDAVLVAYRRVRDWLENRLKERFAENLEKT